MSRLYPMWAVTRWFVLDGGEGRSFEDEAEARAYYRQAQRSCASAELYTVTGELLTDLWRQPKMLAG